MAKLSKKEIASIEETQRLLDIEGGRWNNTAPTPNRFLRSVPVAPVVPTVPAIPTESGEPALPTITTDLEDNVGIDIVANDNNFNQLNRTGATLISIIENYVKTGLIVRTDCWRAYEAWSILV
ncbi:hypothetical protein BD770DRAFT_459128 [Pilaira anomala]|nr:hypothetical protein BD770DRAFT_459128 [Pilaira anomala]